MNKFNNGNIKLAIQKNGRLTEGTIAFLTQSGLEFDTGTLQLLSSCRNFPLDILYVRDDDIGNYVEKGIVDLGIVGQNILYEKRPLVKKLLNLRFGFCALVIAVPRESKVKTIADLRNKKIATTYPLSTQKYFEKKNITVEIVHISGSVEITPFLGLADAIADLTLTGSTLALNDLKVVEKIYDSDAVLIKNNGADIGQKKSKIISKLLIRFNGILSAQKYKYVMMNAPQESIVKLQKILPGLGSPTIVPLQKNGWFSVQSVIQEDVFWDALEMIKKAGGSGIILLPIEKLIS